MTEADAALTSLWRIELLHPALVHFPVALTLVGAAFWFCALAARGRPALAWLAPAAAALIMLAALSAWAGVISGGWADAVVGRHLYDPRVVETHENRATLLAWLLSVTAALNLLLRRVSAGATLRRAGLTAVAALLLVCCGLLAHVGHLGASLVYQQGAAVKPPEIH